MRRAELLRQRHRQLGVQLYRAMYMKRMMDAFRTVRLLPSLAEGKLPLHRGLIRLPLLSNQQMHVLLPLRVVELLVKRRKFRYTPLGLFD